MPNYRRARVPGASYFFTVTLADRAEHWLVEQIDALRGAFARTRGELPFRVDAIVVLPDHLHCIWTLPPGDANFSLRWQRIKGRFTHACHAADAVRTTPIARPSPVGRSFSAPIARPSPVGRSFSAPIARPGPVGRSFSAPIARPSPVGRSFSAPIADRRIWQHRFWEHVLRDDRDFERHVDYIHFNPVKHGHAGRAADWPHSSIHRYIRTGLLLPDWAGDAEIDACAGEWE